MTPDADQTTTSRVASDILAAASDWMTVRRLYDAGSASWGYVRQTVTRLYRRGLLERRAVQDRAGMRGIVRYEYRRVGNCGASA
jgi:predicted DNA-binding transcriptional regulator